MDLLKMPLPDLPEAPAPYLRCPVCGELRRELVRSGEGYLCQDCAMGLIKQKQIEDAEREYRERLDEKYPASDDPELDEALDEAMEKDD